VLPDLPQPFFPLLLRGGKKTVPSKDNGEVAGSSPVIGETLCSSVGRALITVLIIPPQRVVNVQLLQFRLNLPGDGSQAVSMASAMAC
jgi:hypothetical protein